MVFATAAAPSLESRRVRHFWGLAMHVSLLEAHPCPIPQNCCRPMHCSIAAFMVFYRDVCHGYGFVWLCKVGLLSPSCRNIRMLWGSTMTEIGESVFVDVCSMADRYMRVVLGVKGCKR